MKIKCFVSALCLGLALCIGSIPALAFADPQGEPISTKDDLKQALQNGGEYYLQTDLSFPGEDLLVGTKI